MRSVFFFFDQKINSFSVLTFTSSLPQGFYISLVINRWWEVRTLLAALHNYIRNMSVMCATYMSTPDVKNIRETIVRYGNLVHALTFKRHSHDDNWTDLVRGKLITEDEMALLRYTETPMTTICHWMSTLLVCSLANKQLSMPESATPILENLILGLHETSGRIQQSIESQPPFPYVHLITIIVKVIFFSIFWYFCIFSVFDVPFKDKKDFYNAR